LQARSEAFAEKVFGLSKAIRHRPEGWNVAAQLADAANSVAANYRASGHARSRREFVAKLGVVVEEADETVYWLGFVIRTGFVDGGEPVRLLDEARQLAAIFAASYRTARRNLDR
jgi:four helix bundle protein